MTTDLSRLPQLLSDLYRTVEALKEIAPGRHFTPDGHMVGSIGEAVAAYSYGLELLPASTKGYDAMLGATKVQIKLTQGKRVAVSYDCQHLLVLRFDQHAGFEEIYNGPGHPVWDLIGAKLEEGRQRQISVSQLRALQSAVGRLPQVQPFPTVLRKVAEAVAGELEGEAGVEFTNGDAPGVRLRKAKG